MKVQIGGWDQIKHIYDLLDEEERKKGERVSTSERDGSRKIYMCFP